MKSRRGKIYRGTFGKLRPKHPGGKKPARGKTAPSGSGKS
jgi:ribosomal small subunit protein bTHX